MSDIKIYKADVNSQLNILVTGNGILTGFPSMASDSVELPLDLNKDWEEQGKVVVFSSTQTRIAPLRNKFLK